MKWDGIYLRVSVSHIFSLNIVKWVEFQMGDDGVPKTDTLAIDIYILETDAQD